MQTNVRCQGEREPRDCPRRHPRPRRAEAGSTRARLAPMTGLRGCGSFVSSLRGAFFRSMARQGREPARIGDVLSKERRRVALRSRCDRGGGRLLFRVDVRVCPTGLRVERGSREGLGSSARNRRSVTMSPSFCHLFCVGPGSMRAGERGWVRPSAPRVRTQAPPRRASARSGSGSLGEGTRPFPQETVEPRVEWRAQQACAHAVRYAFRARKGSARRDRRPRAFDRKE